MECREPLPVDRARNRHEYVMVAVVDRTGDSGIRIAGGVTEASSRLPAAAHLVAGDQREDVRLVVVEGVPATGRVGVGALRSRERVGDESVELLGELSLHQN